MTMSDEVYRYYFRLRPPGIGCQPKRGLLRIDNFEQARYVECIGRYAHGWAEYDRPLTCDEIRDYELVRGPIEDDARC